MLAVTRLATAVGLLLLAASFGTAAAQPAEKLPRVGYISPGSPSDPFRRFEAFRQGLRELDDCCRTYDQPRFHRTMIRRR
jgi:ABC-type sugar transport system substrate-binding protein